MDPSPRRPRLSPSLLVAVCALVVAAGGTGYAAGMVTSAQIKDDTIVGRDVRNSGLTGADVKDRSLTAADVKDGVLTGRDLKDASIGRAELDRRCAVGEQHLFGGCVRLASTGSSSFQAAVDDCNRRHGRLPTTLEITWIANHVEFAWADGNVSQYEFTGDYTGSSPYTPIGFDRAGNPIDNSSAQLFWHHCVTY